METTSNRFSASFDDDPLLDGSEYIEADLGRGVTVRCYLTSDSDSTCDLDELAILGDDEWQFCAMHLSVYVGGACIAPAEDGCGGMVCGRDGDGDYLTERANQLLADAEETIAGIVRNHAAAAAAAVADDRQCRLAAAAPELLAAVEAAVLRSIERQEMGGRGGVLDDDIFQRFTALIHRCK